ncbi:MAG: DUF3617 domain-containing protein [Agarilytica sp.]
MRLPLLFSILLLSFISSFSFAEAPDIRTGWWQYKVDMKTQSGQLEAAIEQAKAAMANMPPEQRAMMEQMMNGRGMKFDLQNRTFETCITQEDLARMEMPKPDKNCSQTFTKKSAKKYAMSMSCTGNPPSKGTGEFEIVDSKTFKGKVVMETQLQGKPEIMTMQQFGKWVSDTCK